MCIPSLNKDIYSIIISFIPYRKSNWLHLRLINKEFLFICKQVQDPSINNNWAILWACRNGYLEVFKELLKDKRVDPTATIDDVIEYESKKEHVGEIRRLYKNRIINPIWCNVTIRWLSKNGYAQVSRELLKDKRAKPFKLYDCIYIASENGYVDIVKELLKDNRMNTFVNFDTHFNMTIFMVCIKGHILVLEELLKDAKTISAHNKQICLEIANLCNHVSIIEYLNKL